MNQLSLFRHRYGHLRAEYSFSTLSAHAKLTSETIPKNKIKSRRHFRAHFLISASVCPFEHFLQKIYKLIQRIARYANCVSCATAAAAD